MKKGLIAIFCLLVLTFSSLPVAAQTRYRRGTTVRDVTSNARAIGGIKIEFTTELAVAGIDLSGMSIATSSPLVSEQAQARYSAVQWVVRKAQSLERSSVEAAQQSTPTGFEIKTTGVTKLVG